MGDHSLSITCYSLVTMSFLNRIFVSKERVLLLNQQEIMTSPSSFSFYVELLSKKKKTMIQTLYFLIFYSFREGLASENGDTYSNSTRLSRDSVVNDHLPRCHVQDDFSFSTFPKPKQEFMSLIWCPLKHVSPRTYVMVSTKTCLHKV